jgi:hypothetical protein
LLQLSSRGSANSLFLKIWWEKENFRPVTKLNVTKLTFWLISFDHFKKILKKIVNWKRSSITFRKYILKYLCIWKFKKIFVFIFLKYAGVKASHEQINFWMKKRFFTLLFLISRVLKQISILNWNLVVIYNTLKQIKKNQEHCVF